MRKISIAIAAVALAAGPALAQGQGKGGGNGGGGGNDRGSDAAGPVQTAPRGNGGGGGDRGNGGERAERSNGNGNGNSGANGRADQIAQPRSPSARRSESRAEDSGASARAGRDNAQVRSQDRAERGQAQRIEQGTDRRADSANPRDLGRTQVTDRSDGDGDRRQALARNSGQVIDGCPPGLARKNPPCVPPGQAGRSGWMDAANYRPDWWGLSGYGDGRYVYDNGYLMRLGEDGRVGGFIPLLAGALGIGNAWPSYYEPAQLPNYYERYFGLGQSSGYRYADDVIYRVDPTTSAITSIAALLTGDQFEVGQPLPLGYDAYNVPYTYRDEYADSADSLYRYSDGYVYEVDPQTRLIAAAIELLAS